jgi:hypothetical protein
MTKFLDRDAVVLWIDTVIANYCTAHDAEQDEEEKKKLAHFGELAIVIGMELRSDRFVVKAGEVA